MATFNVQTGVSINDATAIDGNGNFYAASITPISGNTITFNGNLSVTGTVSSNNVMISGGGVSSINGETGNVTINASTLTGFANVATSGSYADLSSTPTAATSSTLGLVKVGGNLALGGDGTVSLTSGNVTAALGYTPVNSTAVGAVNGVASLDSNGQLTIGQLPTAVVGAMVFQGSWNATTNIPAIIPSTGTKGQYYVVATAGNTTIDGNNNWSVGDIIAYNGSAWDQIQGGSSDVVSVFGRIGAVTLQSSDVTGALSAGSITNTMLANGAVANLSGTNTGDNAVNTTYANDYRAANFVAGTNYLAPTGNGSGLTSLNASNLASGTVPAARLPTATTSVLGGVKIDGTTITINGSGVISGSSSYSLPTATTSVLGGVKIDGTTITIASGVISANTGGGGGSTLSTVAGSTTYYVGMSAASSGTWTDARVDATNLYYTSGNHTLYATNYNTTSDANFKENVETISDGLAIVNQMRGVSFDWKETGFGSYGVIAQEIEALIPNVVDTNSDTGKKSVNYNALIGFLIEAVKDLSAQVKELKNAV